jgi:hypothetical protein
LSRKVRRAPRAVVDTSVVIAGAAAFRGAPLHPETESGKLLLRWIEPAARNDDLADAKHGYIALRVAGSLSASVLILLLWEELRGSPGKFIHEKMTAPRGPIQ